MVPNDNRVAWITGAGKGIGRALAERLARDGWTVAASARSETDLVCLAAVCPPDSVRPVPFDTTVPHAADTAMARIVEDIGIPDLIILNAGTHRATPVAGFSADAARMVIETNLLGTIHCLDAVMPPLIKRGNGHIAVIASLAGYRGLPYASAYGASKAGLINLCESLRPELDRHGVRLTLVNPGFVKTPLTDLNDFPMPFLIEVEEAVDHILRGLERSAFEVAFPGRFAWLMKLLRIVPYRLFFTVTRRMLRP